MEIKTLDIIFTYPVEIPLDELIGECGLNYGDTLINHVGLYIGNDNVIEAKREGVLITPLKDSLKSTYYIKRLNLVLTSEERQKVIDKGSSYLRKKYNHSFKDTEENIYCSELLVRAFEVLGNKSPFTRHPITFNCPKTGKLDPKWLNYYETEKDIPEGQLGSHPNSLYEMLRFHPDIQLFPSF